MAARRRVVGILGMSLVTGALSGCQTWFGGTTLPSGHYLEHPPQYIPPSPPFPLTREMATMEAQGVAGGAAPAPVPAPAPAIGPGPGLAPAPVPGPAAPPAPVPAPVP